jgi:GNAT superfamily N-acetyltransferase
VTATEPPISVVPANKASWDDLQAVFGTSGPAARCQCQRFKLRRREYFAGFPAEERADRLRQQTGAGHPESDTTSGLVAYLDGEPVGWCAVEPRSHDEGLIRNNRVPGQDREEDKADDSVWAVTCFVVRRGFRRGGVSRVMARVAVSFARDRGARAIEGYPIFTTDVIMEELLIGTVMPGVPLLVSSRRHRRPVVLASWPTSRHSASRTDEPAIRFDRARVVKVRLRGRRWRWPANSPALFGLFMQQMRLRPVRRLPIAFGWLTKRGDATTARWMKPVLQQREIRRDAVRMLRAMARQPSLLVDTARDLPRFGRPALVVWASEDRVMPPEHGRQLAALLPDARLVEIANSYTLLSLDQPAEFAGVIREFVMESAVDVPALPAELLDGTS